MTLDSRGTRVFSLLATYGICIALCSVACAQTAPSKDSQPTLTRQMVGTWKVRQRMWPGFGAEPVNLSPAVARRHLMAGGFLEEVMEPATKTSKASFTRTGFFNYNA